MAFADLALRRCSIRKYSERPVEQGKLDQVLEAARVAPTAKNLQPWRVHALRSPEALAAFDELTTMRFGAPVVLVFTYDVNEDWKNPLEEGIHSGQQDASIAATYAMLQATELGLGTCWCNYLPNARVAAMLGLPKSERVVLALDVGYPAAEAHPAHLHWKRKPLEDLVDYR